MKLPLETPGKHIVTQLDGRRVLVDTGSPLTIGRRARPLPIGGMVHSVTDVRSFDFNHLSHLVGEHIDVVLGNDVLAALPWRAVRRTP